MVEYFVMLQHFVMLGHFKMVSQRHFLSNKAYMIFYHLCINFQVIMDQYQKNKDKKYADFNMSFFVAMLGHPKKRFPLPERKYCFGSLPNVFILL